ncbi:GTPase Era [Candidatus Epulonipiscium viviparus]|uniref:GTPase Era n=1 Tax=Candidatus Epulonipiscium viviparus TaxID=420336 RepID=UPI00016C0DE2|nr:GTPase Era [Candidatus Epulopiscium viviparus]
MKKEFKSGFISIIGRANVGKSTLMNRLVGEKIAIMSNKPQTTRHQVRTILTTNDFQAVFIDTPGIHTPNTELGKFMVKAAHTTLNEVDIILFLIETDTRIGKLDEEIISKLKSVNSAVFLCINKIDGKDPQEVIDSIECYKDSMDFAEVIPISAYEGTNVDALIHCISKYLPAGPKFFPEDMITDEPERQLVAELIREKALHLLDKEIPHGIAIEISSMRKRDKSDMVDIEATIICERDAHKKIIIGKNGQMIKSIGTHARRDIERLLGSKIFLSLWVKVKKNWRDSEFLLKNYGYSKENLLE